MRLRLDATLATLHILGRATRTIVTGRHRGVIDFNEAHPDDQVTEASLMKAYLGPKNRLVVEEPLAIDTIGNIVFSTLWIVRYRSNCPLFISQASHLEGQVTRIADAWFRGSGVKPDYLPVADPDQVRAYEGLVDQLLDRALDPSRGLGHVQKFVHDVPPLSSGATRLKRASIHSAVNWLYSNDGRYREEYGTFDKLLARVDAVLAG